MSRLRSYRKNFSKYSIIEMKNFIGWMIVWAILLAWISSLILGPEYYNEYVKDAISEKLSVVEPVQGETWQEVQAWVARRWFTKYKEVFDILQEQYIDSEELVFSDMQENWLKGFVDAIGDPYTTYLDKKESSAFDETIQGTQNFEWIWAVVTKKKDGVMIEEVIKWSPAFAAGLQALDLILKIWEDATKDIDLFDAVQMIRWPKWTEVLLTIYRENSDEILEITVERGTIDVPSVSAQLFPVDEERNMLFVELFTFWEDTATKIQNIIKEYEGNFDGVIVDLRWNWWGLLPIAVDVASFFLPRGEVVAKVEYSTFQDELLRSKWYTGFQWVPVVVLIDQMSASASEILAWALSEHLWAPLIWATSFWKGSVQSLIELEDGSSLKISIWKWYTPKWVNVKEQWVAATTEVEYSREDYLAYWIDAQLEAAKDKMKEILIIK